MPKNKILFPFLITFFTIIVITFGIHLFILNQLNKSLFSNMIVESYLVNSLLAISIFILLFFSRNKFKTQLGFFFLGGSILKFLFFFIIFNPVYKADGEIQAVEFAAFFIPYFLSLALETIFAARMLNNL